MKIQKHTFTLYSIKPHNYIIKHTKNYVQTQAHKRRKNHTKLLQIAKLLHTTTHTLIRAMTYTKTYRRIRTMRHKT